MVGEEAEGEVKLIVQPEAGIAPLLRAIKGARKFIDIVIFRMDRPEIEKALAAAVGRGVVVRALIAHTNKGGEKTLRKLEQRMLQDGLTVSRTADDLPRYHGKMMITDNAVLHVYGFNYTRLDLKSRSFGIMTRDRRLVQEAMRLFDADMNRKPYDPSYPRLVVSPENSREVLTAFIRGAQKQLLIYDAQVSDNLIQRVLAQRARAGVEIRVIGRMEKSIGAVKSVKLAVARLHVRAIVRDGKAVFVGSQSLRRLELDGRREVGVVITNAGVAKQVAAVFESDWKASKGK